MAGVSVTITAPALPGLEAKLGALLARSRDLSPLMDAIGMAMETTTHERFDAGVAPDGTPWTPSQRATDTDGKTLIDQALLKNSVTHRATSDQVEVGTNKVYARIHQLGFDGPQSVKSHKRHITSAFGLKLKSPVDVIVPEFTRKMAMPARPFLGVSADDEAEIGGLVADHLVAGLDA